MVFQQQKGKGETIAGRSCFVNENGVSATEGEMKKCEFGVSVMKK
jgi:hypothetical protein